MKKFDIEAAKNGAAVCTRDGRTVRIICFDSRVPAYPIVALVGDYCDIKTFTEDGKFIIGDYYSNIDLMMDTTKHTAYVAIYRNEKGNIVAAPQVFSSIEDAEEGTLGWTRIVAISEITWEE